LLGLQDRGSEGETEREDRGGEKTGWVHKKRARLPGEGYATTGRSEAKGKVLTGKVNHARSRGTSDRESSRGARRVPRLPSGSWNGPEMIAASFGRERKVRTPHGSMPGESRGARS